ncbi:hypothetical protein D9M68_526100 [compost metagenome]
MNTNSTSSGRLRKNQMYRPARRLTTGFFACFPSASRNPAATPITQVAVLSFTTTQHAFQKSVSQSRLTA